MEYRICLLECGVVLNLFALIRLVLDKVDVVCCGPSLFVLKPNLFS